MAKLRMTYKNLKALRKSKEYQAMLVDLVASGVISKSKAEDLLGFNIPANLIGGTESSGTDNPIDDNGGSGGESGGEGSGSVDVDITVPSNTVTMLYLNGDSGSWETAEYTLTNSSSEADILDFAKTEFGNGALNSILYVEANPDYVEGVDDINSKYIALNPQPETIEPGMFATVYYYDENGMVSKE